MPPSSASATDPQGPLPAGQTAPDPAGLELLSFHLGAQEYALDIISVREIRGWTEATPLPHAPAFLRGVINLRGTVLPIIDLPRRLALDGGAERGRNVIVVVQSAAGSAGLLVDAVSDIVTLPPEALQTPPELGGTAGPSCIRALAIHEGRMLRLLDLAAVLPAPGAA